jgi:predicted metal-binding membrane protein
VDFFARNFRPGVRGALRLGFRYGLYCLGCCGLLMGLLFVGGVMNLLWIAALSVFVLAEKVIPLGAWGGRVAGVALIGSGAGWLLLVRA